MIGPKILLEGPAGTGKTYALGTLADWAQAHSYPMRVLFTENGLESLLGYWTDRGKEIPSCLAWHNCLTTPLNLKALISAADMVGKLTYESLTKMTPDRSSGNAFHKILSACANFHDDRTNTSLGAVDSWPATSIFVIDGLSELGNASMKMVVGTKPTASPSDYGVAQQNLLNFIRLLTQSLPCTFVLLAHVTRQVDEISGSVKLMTKGPGKALADEIPQLFSDVVLTQREGDKFYWDTAAGLADLKTRNLPIRSKLSPDFAQIMDKWQSRVKGTST